MAISSSTIRKNREAAAASNHNKSVSSGGKTTNTPTTTVNTSKTNSQYTAPTLGNTYNPTTDYQSIINNAVNNGDYVTAAQAEVLRNQKIDATGSNYNKTHNYLSYLPDIGTYGQQLMANNASKEDVLAAYNARNYKASTTEGLSQYQNDEIQQLMWDYIVNQTKESNQPEDFVYDEEKPTAPQSDPRIDALLNEILNRESFSYDAMNDPLYQQYADMYQREGDRAMRDTLAEVAAGAGGMNSYAVTAAMQANNYYNSQLTDKIPELYNLAYQMYLNDIDLKVQDLGILQDMDATQYNRYRDTMTDWKDDRNFAYDKYYNDVQQGNWLTNFDYNSMLDSRNWNNDQYWANKEWNYNDEWKNKEYNDNRADIEYERNQAEVEEAKATIDWLIQNGVSTIDPELIAKAGLTQTAVNQAVANYKAEQATKGSSGGGSSSSKKKTKEIKEIDEREDGIPPEQVGSTPYSQYGEIVAACEKYASEGDEWSAAACARKAFDNGVITQEQYNALSAKYNPLLDSILNYDPLAAFKNK